MIVLTNEEMGSTTQTIYSLIQDKNEKTKTLF